MNTIENLNSQDTQQEQPNVTELDRQIESDIIEPALQERTVRLTTFILLSAIAAALITFWFMHKKATAPKSAVAATDQQLVLETAITELTGISSESVSQVDELVKKFYEFTNFGQVDPKVFRRNPFSSPLIFSNLPADSATEKSITEEIKSEAQKMELQSIMQSKFGSCCMINDTLLYKGDKINGFEIVEIGSDFVRLQLHGQTITLYLQTE